MTTEFYTVNWQHAFLDKIGTKTNCTRQEVNVLTDRSDIYITDIIKWENGKRALLFCDDTGFTAEQYIRACKNGILNDFDISIIKWLSLSETNREVDLATRMRAGRAAFTAKSQPAQLLTLYDCLTELAVAIAESKSRSPQERKDNE